MEPSKLSSNQRMNGGAGMPINVKSCSKPSPSEDPIRFKNAPKSKNPSLTPKKSGQAKGLERFVLINQASQNNPIVPIMGIKNENGVVKYPLLLCSQEGTIMLALAAGVLLEICVDRSFRLVCNEDFMAYVNAGGGVSSIVHRFAKIVHSGEHVHCKFIAVNDRFAVLGAEGVLFSMQHLQAAYLLNSGNESRTRPSVVAIDKPEFPIKEIDYSLHQMYAVSQMGTEYISQCNEIVQKAGYERKRDGTLVIHINGIHIKSNADTGEVSIQAKPIFMTMNSQTNTVHLRSAFIDMAVQDRDKCYVKRADNRIHTSRSGMVVSDGTCNISIDQHGEILSCS
ncbi:unnamed protein product [Caenorhabditis bovis]|uniref:Uncharacterized protein n=1 Tax=Caenorhabditis bovis TaxID=2654633 RepID=A0A8S1ETF1_9PELO|nr:unnamed protein product [Caenorhabditis bovis]